MTRTTPNILITGTPGTGKTTTAQLLSAALNFSHIEVGKLVKEKGLHDGFDEEFQSFLIDEDRVLDEMEDLMKQGGVVVDHHGCGFFPERWFDLVVCLSAPTEVFGYAQNKIQENMQCEIMRVVAEEAYESYQKEIVVELVSSTVEDMEQNVERIEAWVEQFIATH